MKSNRIFYCCVFSLIALSSCKSKQITPDKKSSSVVDKTEHCREDDSALKYKTKAEAHSQLIKAIEKPDIAKLNRMAACRFFIGLPNSDISALGSANKIMKLLINTFKNLTWPAEGSDYKTQYNIVSTQDDYFYELVLRKSSTGAWYWAGFSTSDEALLRELALAGEFKSPDETD